MSAQRSTQAHRLFLEPPAGGVRDPSHPEVAEVPPGQVVYAAIGTRGRFALSKSPTADGIVLESVRHGNQFFLAVMPFDERVRIDGLPAAPLNLVKAGAVVDCGFGNLQFHVTVFSSPYVGPPKPEHIGVECGYCRLSIEESPEMQIYVCPVCGTPMHCVGEDIPEESRLECAKLASACGHCKESIVTGGYSYIPEFHT